MVETLKVYLVKLLGLGSESLWWKNSCGGGGGGRHGCTRTANVTAAV